MLSLKEFAIPFGLLCFAIWVWLFASRPWLLLFAFFVTFAVVILFYRNEDVQQLIFERQRVLSDWKSDDRQIIETRETCGPYLTGWPVVTSIIAWPKERLRGAAYGKRSKGNFLAALSKLSPQNIVTSTIRHSFAFGPECDHGLDRYYYGSWLGGFKAHFQVELDPSKRRDHYCRSVRARHDNDRHTDLNRWVNRCSSSYRWRAAPSYQSPGGQRKATARPRW